MKKIFSMVLAVIMIAAVFAVSAAAMYGEGFHDHGDIVNVERNSVLLDAEKDAAYNNATPIDIKYDAKDADGNCQQENISTSGYNGNMDFRKNGEAIAKGTAYIVYDTKYIYAFIEVIDNTLATSATSATSSNFKQDSVEILIDWTNEGKDLSNKTPYQSRVTHEGYISARLGSGGTTMQGSVADGGPDPVNWLDGVGKHTTNPDGSLKGYNVEFRIKIPSEEEIGQKIGEHISIMFMINDYDSTGGNADSGAGKNTRIMVVSEPNGTNQWKINRAGYIGINYTPYTADTTVIYVVIAMVTALAIGMAAVVSLRRRAK